MCRHFVVRLKHILQRELDDPRIKSSVNLAEDIAAENECLIAFSENAEFSSHAVCHIERLGSKFQHLFFPDVNKRDVSVQREQNLQQNMLMGLMRSTHMPNWCKNVVVVTGTAERLKEFRNAVKGKNLSGVEVAFTFNSLIPFPEEFRVNDEARRRWETQNQNKWPNFGNNYNDGGLDWFDLNWFTKWDAQSVRVEDDNAESLVYHFRTAWTPPLP